MQTMHCRLSYSQFVSIYTILRLSRFQICIRTFKKSKVSASFLRRPHIMHTSTSISSSSRNAKMFHNQAFYGMARPSVALISDILSPLPSVSCHDSHNAIARKLSISLALECLEVPLIWEHCAVVAAKNRPLPEGCGRRTSSGSPITPTTPKRKSTNSTEVFLELDGP